MTLENSRRFVTRLLVALVLLAACGAESAAATGEELYKQHCAACHDQVSPRIPPREALQRLPAARILRSLDFGAMMSVAYPLRRKQREAIAGGLVLVNSGYPRFGGAAGQRPAGVRVDPQAR